MKEKKIMAQLNPYIHFDGNCKEAMNFYKDALGGDLTLQTIGESPMAGGMPKEEHNKVLHSVLTKDGFVLMASDMMQADRVVRGNAYTLCLVCNSKQEIETLYSKLSAGGNVTHPLKEEFFGTFGDCTDKYGVDWMFQFGSAPQP
jgi:PhnB protein